MSLRPETATSSPPITASPSPTKADRLHQIAKEAETRGDNTVHTVRIGSKEYYVIDMTGGRLNDLGALSTQASKVDALFKAAVNAHGEDFAYMDGEGAHHADGTLVEHSEVLFDKAANRHFEEATDGGFSQYTTKNQEGMLTLYGAVIEDSSAHIDKATLISLTKDLSLPQEIQHVVDTHTSRGTPIPKATLIKDLETAHAKYGVRLVNETKEGISPHDDLATAAYDSAKPTRDNLARIKSKVNRDGADLRVNTLAEQFAVHNAAARQVRTAQHAWNALAKIVDTTVHTHHPFPDFGDLFLIPKDSPSSHSRSAPGPIFTPGPTLVEKRGPSPTARAVLANVSPKTGTHAPVSYEVGKGTLDLSALEDPSPLTSLSPTPLASGTRTPKLQASTPDGSTHTKGTFDSEALAHKLAALPQQEPAETEPPEQQSSSVINKGNAVSLGTGVITGLGAVGVGATLGSAALVGATTVVAVKGVQKGVEYLRGSPTTTAEGDGTTLKKPPE